MLARSRVRIYMCLFQPSKTRQQDRTRIGPFSACFSRFVVLRCPPGCHNAQDSGHPKTARCGFCRRSPSEVLSRLTEACLAASGKIGVAGAGGPSSAASRRTGRRDMVGPGLGDGVPVRPKRKTPPALDSINLHILSESSVALESHRRW